MKYIKVLTLLFALSIVREGAEAQKPALLQLKYESNYSPTYQETIGMYRILDDNYPEARLVEAGKTDCGKPLHIFILSKNKKFDVGKLRKEGKTILLINNGIHPGEPEGIDASLQFADDILRNKDGMKHWLDNTVVVIIPVYNIGGALNRSAWNRSGQTTPYETGFRGNYANLDLNRDFTKCDSENARSFTQIFQYWNPDVFLDTHTTNGSDHQYSITLIAPHPDQFPPALHDFLDQTMIPSLFSEMKKGEYELIPYVDWFYNDPRSGIQGVLESPRYSTGYASLYNSLGMITENLIYKSFPDRVKSVYQFICTLVKYTSENGKTIQMKRLEAMQQTLSAKEYAINYKLDSTKFLKIEFKGYETDKNQVSRVTGVSRMGYDRSRPYTDSIRYYNSYIPSDVVKVPAYYVLPQAWKPVLDRLSLNNIQHKVLQKDTLMEVTSDYLEEVSGSPEPYNGHYYHDKVITRSEVQKIQFYAGDWLIPVRQERMRYIIEMLEPRAKDSFFRWNFFDSVLDQREYFSPYGFEENALRTLKEIPGLQQELDARRAADPAFAGNHNAQMGFIYSHSPWLEKTWKRYPVARIFM